jgi:tRNA nucleotidyltransferase (CCA-adding enzyme)
VGSGLAPDAGWLAELRRRIDDELRSNPPLSLADLAVRGDDLTRELNIRPGPVVGRLLERLLRLVIADPAQNRPDLLIEHARDWLKRDEHR